MELQCCRIQRYAAAGDGESIAQHTCGAEKGERIVVEIHHDRKRALVAGCFGIGSVVSDVGVLILAAGDFAAVATARRTALLPYRARDRIGVQINSRGTGQHSGTVCMRLIASERALSVLFSDEDVGTVERVRVVIGRIPRVSQYADSGHVVAGAGQEAAFQSTDVQGQRGKGNKVDARIEQDVGVEGTGVGRSGIQKRAVGTALPEVEGVGRCRSDAQDTQDRG